MLFCQDPYYLVRKMFLRPLHKRSKLPYSSHLNFPSKEGLPNNQMRVEVQKL